MIASNTKIRHITPKKGLRVLGVAESFLKKSNVKKSILAGVVMRGDLQIDGFSFEHCTVGGMDATDAVIKLYRRLQRRDIRVIILSGTVISLYNVIDLQRLYNSCHVPVVAITYEPSEGLDKYLLELPDGDYRLMIYKKNGPRVLVRLRNNYYVYIRPYGITVSNAVQILNLFAIHGRYIEPVRVARILARSLFRFLYINTDLCIG